MSNRLAPPMSKDQRQLIEYLARIQGTKERPATGLVNTSALRACLTRGWLTIIPTPEGTEAVQREKDLEL